jgi:hypothetical protein
LYHRHAYDTQQDASYRGHGERCPLAARIESAHPHEKTFSRCAATVGKRHEASGDDYGDDKIEDTQQLLPSRLSKKPLNSLIWFARARRNVSRSLLALLQAL